MMARFRKKPVEVEAVQFTGDNWAEIHAFTGHKTTPQGDSVDAFVEAGTYTLTGRDEPDVLAEVWDKLHSTWVGVKRGQWIIEGVQGEFYPCDNEVFAATYDAVAGDAS